ncbi:ribonuclease Z [Streptomyces winkii]|uniref:ribonuclease Z n=1 Tax=Streptomyces winkii TaxID=3051178 RepID=UPI0028D53DA8|nr:ribonuclease Z [Streptomyces sp. DSM 40971]
MSSRELVVLGTASQVPTRHRNHNGYVLLWDGHGILFDPGEGTQRQMLRAGVSAHDLTRICVTHFHGDHALGLAGVIQRINLDRVPHAVTAHYPASGERFFERLRYATAYRETVRLRPEPVAGTGELASPGPAGPAVPAVPAVPVGAAGPGESAESAEPPPFTLFAHRLSHPVEAYGYRLTEPDSRRMLPERLEARGIRGPDVSRLKASGELRGVRLEEVSEPRPGQRFAFVMDTRMCDGVLALAQDCDLLVIEATFLDEDAALAEEYGHLTAGQAGAAAAEAGVRSLVLTHFSQRYRDASVFARQARQAGFEGELTVAEDLSRVPVPKRRS